MIIIRQKQKEASDFLKAYAFFLQVHHKFILKQGFNHLSAATTSKKYLIPDFHKKQRG